MLDALPGYLTRRSRLFDIVPHHVSMHSGQ